MKYSYNWLQSYFEKTLPSAKEIEQVLGLRAFEPEGIEETAEDTILDFDILPNRAHDCLSHWGLAKEIALLFPEFKLKENSTKNAFPAGYSSYEDDLQVQIIEPEMCRRYMAVSVKNIKVQSSPEWLKKRLLAIGQKPINNVVDATNYVMFNLGQPLHAFDKSKLDGQQIVVRRATSQEKINLLSGEEVGLDEDTLIIADQQSPLAIAGIKGGKKAEVNEKTTSIVIESANFHPVKTRLTSRKYKVHTDSSKRFENEISTELAELAIYQVLELILEIAGSSETLVGKVYDIHPKPTPNKTILFNPASAQRILGVEVGLDFIKNTLMMLGIKVSQNKDDLWELKVPSLRFDLKQAEDIIEEIGRVFGYENIKATLPEKLDIVINKEFWLISKVRQTLEENGWYEVSTYTFSASGEIEMANALASDKRFLRTNLAEYFYESLTKNFRNRELFGLDGVKQFEIGSVFFNDTQHLHLILGEANNKKKQKLEELNNAINLLEEKLGKITVVKQDDELGYCEISLTSTIDKVNSNSYEDIDLSPEGSTANSRKFHEFSIYPHMTRDISIWLPADTSPEKVVEVIKDKIGHLLVREPRVFDKFSKEDKTSYAFRLVLQSNERTLTDEEVNKQMDLIVQEINSKENWEVR